ncbi:MAG: DUF2813 domain-containing protein [Bryobacterales bacterium]|nr:DUF2813 domain-containing protein [Bryobacterales bacterium]
MMLRSLSVENFRGVEAARLDFDETTVLLGENDAGRTSLLFALDLVLGQPRQDAPFTVTRAHFHQPKGWKPGLPLRPIRIIVGFAERSLGEWLGPAFAPLAGILRHSNEAARRLWLEVTIDEGAPATGQRFSWEFRISEHGPALGKNDRGALDCVRRLNPLIWLRAGVMATTPSSSPAAAAMDEAPPQTAVAEEVGKQYQRILSGASENPLQTLELGYRAAQTLLDVFPKKYRKTRPTLGSVLQEISGLGAGTVAPARRSVAPGAAAQRLGTFLLMGAVVRAARHLADEWSAPILVIEDPESHLHPMTVASVWAVLEEINLQKVIATHSGTLLASAPLSTLRRLVRKDGVIAQHRVPPGGLSRDDMRRLTYHLRSRRSVATFARCLLLVEGETEFWLLPELAHICGYDFSAEGVTCVEFAQCGLAPLVRFARHMGIEWHLLTDGDDAGSIYRRKAENLLGGDPPERHITQLKDYDIERCFWTHGYAHVYQRAAYGAVKPGLALKPRPTIQKAIDKCSKPQMAVRVLEAAGNRGANGVPAPLRNTIETCIRLARGQ